ncbi:hypothetical protein CRUP_000270 [Coryphaenoides rupestris]|nr:hypothetical protein CRUP_000270 [Coryphaenoides rupestris]
MSVMMQRLTQLEATVKRQAQEIDSKLFLSDYGLIWVGDGGRSMEEEEELQTCRPERTMWHPDTSTAPGFHVNFDLVLRNIRQLNLAGAASAASRPRPTGRAWPPGSPSSCGSTATACLYLFHRLQKGSSDAQNRPATLVDTPALQALDERLRRRGSDPHSSADDAVTTLRVKSEDGSQSYIVKMHGSETIDHLRQYLDKHRGKVDPGYDIISVFPRQCYRDGSQTLSSCGLTQSATLLLRPQKGSSQSPGPHD